MENRRMKNFKELYCFQNLFHNLRETFYKLQQIEQDACTGVHSACRREEMCTIRRLRLRQGQMQEFLGLMEGRGVLICKYGI